MIDIINKNLHEIHRRKLSEIKVTLFLVSKAG